MTDKPLPSFLQGFQQDAAQAQAALAGGGRYTPVYFRASKRKGDKGQPVGTIEVVNPAERDANNKAVAKQFDSLEVVVLNHTMTREMKYTGADGKLKTECFSVGPKKTGVGVGTLHNGAMNCHECAALFPEGWERPHIGFDSDQVTLGKVKCNSRYQLTVLLPEEAWVDNKPTVAMAFLPMTSAYGVMIRDAADASERAKTLLSYPEKGDPGQHKGVLHELLTREWATGKELGIATTGTPPNTIKLIVTSEWLGNTTQPVPAFVIGDELDLAGLELVDGLRAEAGDTARQQIEQMAKDAYPPLAQSARAGLAAAAVEGRWDDVGSTARLALPLHAEAIDEGYPRANTPADLGVHKGPQQVAQVASIGVDEEFPPEELLPF